MATFTTAQEARTRWRMKMLERRYAVSSTSNHSKNPTNLKGTRIPMPARQGNYKVAILYRLTNLPSACIPNNWLGYPGESGHIKAICCGPSDDHGCIVGSRIKPCAHGATALKLECVIPLKQNSFHSTHCCVVLVQERHFGCISGFSGQSSLVHKMERKKALTKV